MRMSEVHAGGTYAVKVSERIVPVTLRDGPDYSGRYRGLNVATGRELARITPARCRFELERAEGCAHWIRPGRDIAVHRARYHGGPAE